MKNLGEILVTGGTGFIGGHLCRNLLQQGYSVNILTRQSPSPARDPHAAQVRYVTRLDELDPGTRWYAIINLAGEPLNAGRWNPARKALFRDSRVHVTRLLTRWISTLAHPPAVFLSGSAIGWYGHHQDQPLDESSAPHGGYAHELCRDWESAATEGLPPDTRCCCVRIGVVLGGNGGPLPEMLLPARLGLGGAMGSGRQWWSWIHVEDVVRLFVFLLGESRVSGPVNATAPNPVPQRDFARALGQVLHRPAFMPLPAFAAELLLGEFAREILLNGQRVLPEAAQAAGFGFKYPELVPALENLLHTN